MGMSMRFGRSARRTTCAPMLRLTWSFHGWRLAQRLIPRGLPDGMNRLRKGTYPSGFQVSCLQTVARISPDYPIMWFGSPLPSADETPLFCRQLIHCHAYEVPVTDNTPGDESFGTAIFQRLRVYPKVTPCQSFSIPSHESRPASHQCFMNVRVISSPVIFNRYWHPDLLRQRDARHSKSTIESSRLRYQVTVSCKGCWRPTLLPEDGIEALRIPTEAFLANIPVQMNESNSVLFAQF